MKGLKVVKKRCEIIFEWPPIKKLCRYRCAWTQELDKDFEESMIVEMKESRSRAATPGAPALAAPRAAVTLAALAALARR